MVRIITTRPHLSEQVETLRHQHDEFREILREIIIGLERVTTGEVQQFSLLCDRLKDLLAKLDEHSKQEIDLIQEALLREEGGEG